MKILGKCGSQPLRWCLISWYSGLLAPLPQWTRITHVANSILWKRQCVWLLKLARKGTIASVSLSFLDHLLWGKRQSCCEDPQAALRRGQSGEKLRLPANSTNLPASWLSYFRSSTFHSCKSSDDAGPNQHLSCNIVRPWARMTQLSHFQIWNPQKFVK